MSDTVDAVRVEFSVLKTAVDALVAAAQAQGALIVQLQATIANLPIGDADKAALTSLVADMQAEADKATAATPPVPAA